MVDDCLFCKIVLGEIPAKLVAQNDYCIAFRDIDPRAPTHVLIVPREHVAGLNELKDPAIVGHMALLARQIAEQQGVAAGGYRTVINTGPDAGQTVAHLHMHLLGGRSLGWPPG